VYVVTATKPVHRLQIRPIVHNYRHLLPFSQVTSGPCSSARECGEGQTDRQSDTQTVVANIHFSSAVPHAKCNELMNS